MLEASKTIAGAWEGRFATHEYELVIGRDNQELLHLDFEDGNSYEATGAEIYDIVFNSGQLDYANGTFHMRKKVLFLDC